MFRRVALVLGSSFLVCFRHGSSLSLSFRAWEFFLRFSRIYSFSSFACADCRFLFAA